MEANSPSIRVLHVVRPAQGGMRRHLELLLPRVQERGVEAAVAAPSRFPLDLDAPTVLAPIAARPNPVHDIQAVRIVAAAARDADLLHGHGLRGAWIAGLAAARVRKPFLFTTHNLAPPVSPLINMLVRWVARRADGIIAVSDAVARSLAAFRIPLESILVIPNGIDLAPFDCPVDPGASRAALGVGSAARIIAAAGRLSREKGFHVLVEAAPSILASSPDTRIVIAGDGPERPRLSGIAASLGAADRIILPGRLSDIPGLFAACEIVAAPSLTEGQGLTILEAMAARRPVVASRTGGIPEVVKDGETGLLVPPGDPGALAKALICLLDHEDDRTRMGSAGRARVESLFTADLMADRVLTLYRASC